MRLIDADEFKKQIAAAAIINDSATMGMAICKAIDKQPTAYDPDKVVQQLKSEGCIIDNAAGEAMIEILDIQDADQRLDITPELEIAAYNILRQACRKHPLCGGCGLLDEHGYCIIDEPPESWPALEKAEPEWRERMMQTFLGDRR